MSETVRPADQLVAQLSAAREAAGLTRRAVAAMLDVTPTAVGQWENGSSRPSIDTAVRWAHVLGCTLAVPEAAPGLARWAHALPAGVADRFEVAG